MFKAGDQIQFWTIIGKGERDKHGNKKWLCRCVCGAVKEIHQGSLSSGKSKSCGCATRHIVTAAVANARFVHGEARRGEQTPEYNVYNHMKQRCLNPRDKRYDRYGGRGITICDRWLDSFEAFLEDMGRRPSSAHTIDRIDNDGNYEPGNCRWATQKQQQRNRGNSVIITAFGLNTPLRELCERFNGNARLIRLRLQRGWTQEDALTKPTGPNGGSREGRRPIDLDAAVKMIRREAA